MVLTYLALAACGEVDTAGTVFRCDERRGCPDDQTCVFGRCRRGGVAGEVGCGGATCSAMEQCCVDSVNPPRCIPAGEVCPGVGALCDGLEDCQAGDRCCSAKLGACHETCDDVACTTAEACPSDEPHCCPNPGTPTPWGECRFAPC